MKEPIWISMEQVLSIHTRQIREFGGLHGIRNKNLLESALARTEHLFSYAKPTLFDLASTYAHGIIKNHPFVDGNKRAAITTAAVFLARNDHDLDVDEAELVTQVLALASNAITEKEFSTWLKANCKKLKNS